MILALVCIGIELILIEINIYWFITAGINTQVVLLTVFDLLVLIFSILYFFKRKKEDKNNDNLHPQSTSEFSDVEDNRTGKAGDISDNSEDSVF